ncbi:MAG: hypothetical protein WCK91_02990, partial [bacterium]
TTIILGHTPRGRINLSRGGFQIGVDGSRPLRTPEEVLKAIQNDDTDNPTITEADLVSTVIKHVRSFDYLRLREKS